MRVIELTRILEDYNDDEVCEIDNYGNLTALTNNNIVIVDQRKWSKQCIRVDN